MKVLCNDCSQQAGLVRGSVLHPHRPDLVDRWFWRCVPCDAHVGCHRAGKGYGNGTKPLGRLANAELRQAKQAAHAAFDPLWEIGAHDAARSLSVACAQAVHPTHRLPHRAVRSPSMSGRACGRSELL